VSAGAFLEKLYYRLNLVCLLLSTAAESRAVQQPTLFSDIQAQLTTAKSRRVARRRTEDLSTIQERLLWSEVNV
jgi:DNA-binding NtrC family response regulator